MSPPLHPPPPENFNHTPHNSNFEQLVFSSKAHLPANVFHKITGITGALKKNPHDQSEQAVLYIEAVSPDVVLK